MVRTASDKTLWAMSVNQIEDRKDRLNKEAGSIYPDVIKCRKKPTAQCKKINKRYKKIQNEIGRTNDIARITKHYARLRQKKKR